MRDAKRSKQGERDGGGEGIREGGQGLGGSVRLRVIHPEGEGKGGRELGGGARGSLPRGSAGLRLSGGWLLRRLGKGRMEG